MRVWVCIPVHNRLALTVRCLESLQAQTYEQVTVVLCDDGSTDGTSLFVQKRFPEVVQLSGDGSLWWTAATNLCVEYVLSHASASDWILTLNNDVELAPDYIASLVDAGTRHRLAIITSVVYDVHTRELVTAGVRLSWVTAKTRQVRPARDKLEGDASVAEVTYASGRGTLVPVEVFQRIGLFDERRLPHYAADLDFTQRARRSGFPVLVCFAAAVYSHVQETGMTAVRRRFSLSGFLDYLTNRKSPANLRARWWFAVKNCPKALLPSFLLLDVIWVVGSYFRHHLVRVLGAR